MLKSKRPREFVNSFQCLNTLVHSLKRNDYNLKPPTFYINSPIYSKLAESFRLNEGEPIHLSKMNNHRTFVFQNIRCHQDEIIGLFNELFVKEKVDFQVIIDIIEKIVNFDDFKWFTKCTGEAFLSYFNELVAIEENYKIIHTSTMNTRIIDYITTAFRLKKKLGDDFELSNDLLDHIYDKIINEKL